MATVKPDNRPAKGFTVAGVGAAGATIKRPDGSTSGVSWDVLRSAACQDDRELSTAYSALLRAAEEIALIKSPLLVRYGQDSTNVWWHAWVETAWGGIRVGRTWHTMRIVAADEGGTLAREWMAKGDAMSIAARICRVAPGHDVRVVPAQS